MKLLRVKKIFEFPPLDTPYNTVNANIKFTLLVVKCLPMFYGALLPTNQILRCMTHHCFHLLSLFLFEEKRWEVIFEIRE